MGKLIIIMNDEERHKICVEKIIAVRFNHIGFFRKRFYLYTENMIIPYCHHLPINLKFTVQQRFK